MSLRLQRKYPFLFCVGFFFLSCTYPRLFCLLEPHRLCGVKQTPKSLRENWSFYPEDPWKGTCGSWRLWGKSWKGEMQRRWFPNSVYGPARIMSSPRNCACAEQTQRNIAKASWTKVQHKPAPRVAHEWNRPWRLWKLNWHGNHCSQKASLNVWSEPNSVGCLLKQNKQTRKN